MYSAQIVLDLMTDITDVLGLEATLRFRVEMVYPQLQTVNAKKFGHVASRERLKTDFAGLSAKTRKLRRTLKGLNKSWRSSPCQRRVGALKLLDQIA
jgi:hypothetical protein